MVVIFHIHIYIYTQNIPSYIYISSLIMVYHIYLYLYPKTTKKHGQVTHVVPVVRHLAQLTRLLLPPSPKKSAGWKRRNVDAELSGAAKEIAASQKVATFWQLENKSGSKEDIEGFLMSCLFASIPIFVWQTTNFKKIEMGFLETSLSRTGGNYPRHTQWGWSRLYLHFF